MDNRLFLNISIGTVKWKIIHNDMTVQQGITTTQVTRSESNICVRRVVCGLVRKHVAWASMQGHGCWMAWLHGAIAGPARVRGALFMAQLECVVPCWNAIGGPARVRGAFFWPSSSAWCSAGEQLVAQLECVVPSLWPSSNAWCPAAV